MLTLSRLWSVLLLIGLSQIVSAQTELFSTFPEAEQKKSFKRHYDKYTLVTGYNNGEYLTEVIHGQLERLNFDIPKTYSEENIYNNYLKSIKANDGEIIFSCIEKEQCGRAKDIQQIIKPLNDISDRHPHLITAKFQLANKLIYTSVYVYSWSGVNNLQIDTVEIKPQPLDLLKINSDYLKAPSQTFQFTPLESKDVKNSQDHPLISRIPGSRIYAYKTLGFEKNQLVTNYQNKQYQKVLVDGKTTFIHYQIPREYSELEIIENYRAALNNAGFQQLFSCNGQLCGHEAELSRAIHLDGVGTTRSQRYLVSRLERQQGNLYTVVYVKGHQSGVSASLHIIEEKPLNNDRLSINVSSIEKAILLKGHIALDGLLFSYDSDKLLPESKTSLNQVAEYLKTVPEKQFYIVGHTDDKGQGHYNVALSMKRAQKIIQLLKQNYAIDTKNLTAHGAGEYVPVANNNHEEGRQLNRRVELVLRSDGI